MNKNALLRNVASYPDRIGEIDGKFAKAVAKLATIKVDPKGDFTTEVRRFAAELRGHEASVMMYITEYQFLESEMQKVERNLRQYQAQHPGDEAVATSLVTLAMHQATLEAAMQSCIDHYATVRQNRDALATIQRQQNMAQLLNLYRGLQAARQK